MFDMEELNKAFLKNQSYINEPSIEDASYDFNTGQYQVVMHDYQRVTLGKYTQLSQTILRESDANDLDDPYIPFDATIYYIYDLSYAQNNVFFIYNSGQSEIKDIQIQNIVSRREDVSDEAIDQIVYAHSDIYQNEIFQFLTTEINFKDFVFDINKHL